MSDGCYLDLELRNADHASLDRALEMLKKDESFVEATGPDRIEPPASGFLLKASFAGYDGLSFEVSIQSNPDLLCDLMRELGGLSIRGSWEIENSCGGTVDGDHSGGMWTHEEMDLWLDFSGVQGITADRAAIIASKFVELLGTPSDATFDLLESGDDENPFRFRIDAMDSGIPLPEERRSEILRYLVTELPQGTLLKWGFDWFKVNASGNLEPTNF